MILLTGSNVSVMDGPGQAWNLEAQDGEDGQVRDAFRSQKELDLFREVCSHSGALTRPKDR